MSTEEQLPAPKMVIPEVNGDKLLFTVKADVKESFLKTLPNVHPSKMAYFKAWYLINGLVDQTQVPDFKPCKKCHGRGFSGYSTSKRPNGKKTVNVVDGKIPCKCLTDYAENIQLV